MWRFKTESELKKEDRWYNSANVPNGWGLDNKVNGVLGQILPEKYWRSLDKNRNFSFSYENYKIEVYPYHCTKEENYYEIY